MSSTGALDYFDVMAEGNDAPALWIVDENGREEKVSFRDLSVRSNQVANRLRQLGVQRGERILLMLGNERPLWEIMFAAMKLGANDRERMDEVMRDGYYHTGDVAQLDDEGYITYVGRADDVFKSSDYRISPFELESVLIEHPGVAEAAVVPSPDALRLSLPKAFVTVANGHVPGAELARDILGFCRERLAPYQ